MTICRVPCSGESDLACWRRLARALLCCLLSAQLAGALSALPADRPADSARASDADQVLETMKAELNRASTELGKSEPAPYYLSYTVYDQNFVVLVGAYGSLLTDT